MAHITEATSVYTGSGTAFTGTGPDTLIVDADAFLISESGGNGATLTGSWDVVINGQVAAFEGNGIKVNSAVSDVVNITVGSSGDVFGSDFDFGLNLGSGKNTILNKGTITGLLSAGPMKVTNIGIFHGFVGCSGVTDDTFTNFQKVGKVIKNGTIHGLIDLGAGGDHFFGGAKAELVRDGAGADIYNFGGGNDVFLAVNVSGGTDGIDSVNGGSGIDTYNASEAPFSVFVNLDTRARSAGQYPFFPLAAKTAQGNGINIDSVVGFENVTGGAHDDALFGSSGANTLIGGAGADGLFGFGGRDTHTGGSGADTFHFTTLSDSGTKVSTRDVITDFEWGVDKLDLSEIDANSKTKNVIDQFNLTGHNGFNSFTGDAGQLRFRYTEGGNTIIYGDVNGDAVADFSIKLLGHILLHETDILGIDN